MVAFHRARALFFIAVVALLFPALASAAAVEFRILLDIDNNAATGCTTNGMAGVEQIVAMNILATDTSAQVMSSSRQVCSGGSFGAPVDVDLTPRSISYQPSSGAIMAEHRVAFSALNPSGAMPRGMRLGFTATDGAFTQNVLTHPNGDPIIYPPADGPRRRSVGGGTPPPGMAVDMSAAEWARTPPLVQGIASAGSPSLRLLKIYAFANQVDHFIYFRLDAFIRSDAPFANDDTYARFPGEGLTVVAPGVLANDGDPAGQPLTALPVSVPSNGNVTLNPDGSFTYTPNDPAVSSADSFEYKANNGEQDSNVARVTINVSTSPNAAPTAVDDNYSTDEDVALNVAAPGVLANDTDPDGNPLSATLLDAPDNGAVVLNPDGSFTYTPNANFFGTDTFTYTASDGELSATATVTITILSVDEAPVADNVSVTTNEEQAVAVTLVASDEEGGTLTYTVGTPSNGVLTGTAPNLTYTPNANFFGTDSFTYTVSDGTNTSNVATVSITVNPVNDVPSFTQGPNVSVPANAVANSMPWATAISAGPANESGQALNFIVSNNNNALFSVQPAIAPNGTLTFTPAGNALGTATVTVQLHDNGGTANGGVDTTIAVNFTITLTCPNITVTNPATNTGTAGSPFSQTFTQSAGIGAVTFSTSSTLPNGLSLAANGTLSGTPTQTGTFPIVVTVTDSQGCTGTGPTYNLTINCPTITVTNPATSTGTVSTAFSQTFTQSGAVGSATFTTSSTLPTGLSLAANGTLSGTPTQPGTFPIVVTVTDANGCTGTSATYNLVIGCQTITVTNPATNSGVANAAFSQTFTQSGAVGGATFTTSSALPTGLTLATNGTLSGTPTQTGTFNIVVTVTDGNGCAGTGPTYTLTITCQTITVTNPATTTGTAGTAFSQTFTQSGAIGTPVFTTASTLPAGLTLASNGTLSGTPTQTGTFNIVVTVTDANGCTGNSANYPLVIGCQTINVSNPATTSGTAGAAFSQTFTQTGAIGTPVFSTASALPTGLTLASNGTLSGTPTQTGTFNIVVTVTDANNCTGNSANYPLVIGCQTITVTSPANTNGTVNAAFSEQFTQSGAIGTPVFSTASALPNGITLSPSGLLSGVPTQDGIFAIVVTVTDANGCTGTSATYNLNIACQTITVGNPATTSSPAGTPLNISFTQTGAVGTAVFSTGSTLPSGLTFNANGTLTGTPTQGGAFPIAVTVTDDNGCTGTNPSYTLTITCPTITVTPPATNTGTAGTAYNQTFSQSGGQGTITWSHTGDTLPSGITLNPSTGVLSDTTNAAGTFNITVIATDQNGCQGSTPFTLTINCQTITVTNPGVNTGTVDAPFSQTFTQTGVLGTATWSVQSGPLPAGLTLNPTSGVLSGTPEEDGVFNLTIRVTDTNNCFDDSAYTLTIGCQTITVTNPGVNTGTVDAAFSQTFTQTGAHGTVTWSISAGTPPAGISINPSTGVLSGTPEEDGVFNLTIRATDVNGCFGESAYSLTINCQTITVNNPANATGTVNVMFSETFTQSGAHGSASFATSDPLPSGFTLSTLGVLSGTTTQPGSFPITVTVTDANGCPGTGSVYNLVINCQTITVTNPGVNTGTVNASFSQTFGVTGIIGTATWSVQGVVALPAGLTLNPSTGELSGIPTEDGTFNLTIRATDTNGCFDDTSYTLTINCQTITVTNPSNANGTAGVAFDEDFGQTGAVGTVTWSHSGTLPTGITLDTSTGKLSGTTNQIGVFSITVTATDANGCQGSGTQYDLTIACQSISITNPSNSSIASGQTLGAGFSFSATGILGTATWALETGSLPSGITLNAASGALEGSSTVQGSYAITVKVTDTNTCSAISSTYTLDVVCPTITVSRTGGGSFPNGVFNSPYTGESFTASGGTGPYTFTVGAGFPTGLTLNTDGTISGSPTATGVFNFTVTATDAASCQGSQAFTISVAPQVNGESYNNVGNTQLIGFNFPAPGTPHVSNAQSLLANDSGPGLAVTVVTDAATTQSGKITTMADGSFSYTPPVNFTGTDTYNYTVTSNGVAAQGTVSFVISGKVWYVKNNHPTAGTGLSNDPFQKLAGAAPSAENSSAAGDTIYVMTGDGTTTNQNIGITLKNTQTLFGAGEAVFTVGAITITTPGAGTKPLIGHTAGSAVTLANGNTLTGFTATTTTGTGVNGITGTALTTGPTISNVNIGPTTAAGLNITSSSTIIAALTNVAISGAGTTGIDMNDFGTLTINSGVTVAGVQALKLIGANNATGSTVNGTFGTVTATGGTNGIFLSSLDGTITIPAGSSLSGASGDEFAIGGHTPAINVTYQGNITYSGAGSAISVSASTGIHTGNLTFDTGTLSVTGGTGINIITQAGTCNFYTTSGTATINGAATGVSLGVNSNGAYNFGQPATPASFTITNTTGTSFAVGNTAADITYNGNITQGNNATMVSVTSLNSAGFLTFQNGTLSATNGAAIVLSDADGPVSFSGTTTLNLTNTDAVLIRAGSGGTITFNTNTSISILTGTPFSVRGDAGGGNGPAVNGNITYSGTINKPGTGTLLNVNTLSGALTFNGTLLSGSTSVAAGVVATISNVTGTLTANHLSLDSSNDAFNGTLLSISGANTGTMTFHHLDLFANGTSAQGAGLVASSTPAGGTLTVTNTGGNSRITTRNAVGLSVSDMTMGTSAFGAGITVAGGAGTVNAVNLVNVTGGNTLTITGGSLAGATGATFNVSGGNVSVTTSGTITQANNAAAISVSAHGGSGVGTLQFDGNVTATNGTGLQFNNADGTYNVNSTAGTLSLNGGDAGIDILTGSTGNFTFGRAAAHANINNPTGTAFNVNGSSPFTLTYNGEITKSGTSAGLLVAITTQASNSTITFQNGILTNSSSAGTGINLSDVDGTVNFSGTTTLSGGDNGIDIVGGSTGTVTFASSTSITDPSGTAFNISGAGAVNLTYPGTITDDVGTMVNIVNETGGTKTFTGLITDNDDGDGGGGGIGSVNLDNNDGSTITFSGGLRINAGANHGFWAINGGTVNVCALNPCGTGSAVVNKVTTTTGRTLRVESTNFGSSGLTFQSIGSSGAQNGIRLDTTGGSGFFTVTGTGSDDSGGSILNSTQDGVFLNSTRSITLTEMVINNSSQSQIDATSVNGLTLTGLETDDSGDHGILGNMITTMSISGSSLVRGGDNAGIGNKHGVFITNLRGTSSVTNTTISNSNTIQMFILNNTATVAAPAEATDVLTVSGTTWNLHTGAFAGDHLSVQSDTGGNFKLIVNSTNGINTFTTGGIAVQATASGSGTVKATVTGVNASATTAGVVIGATASGNAKFDIFSNKTANGTGFSGTGSVAIAVTCVTSGACNGFIRDNTVTHTGGAGVDATHVILQGNGTINAEVFQNVVTGNFQRGFYGSSGSGNGTVNLNFHNNNYTGTANAAAGALQGVYIEAGNSAGGPNSKVCLDMAANSVTMVDTTAYRLRNEVTAGTCAGCVFQLKDYLGGGTDTTAISNWITNPPNSNTFSTSSGTPISIGTNNPYSNASGGCPAPSI